MYLCVRGYRSCISVLEVIDHVLVCYGVSIMYLCVRGIDHVFVC